MSDSASQEQRPHDREEHDQFFEFFVQLVNDNRIELAVTAASGGFLLTGYLISGRDYFEGLSKTLTGRVDTFRTYADMYPEQALSADAANPAEDLPSVPYYYHMRLTALMGAGPVPVTPGDQPIFWRGRLSQVQGFTLGIASAAHDTNVS